MLGIKEFEFYSGDRAYTEYMLSKLIIAKQIESMGVTVPDHYLFYESFQLDYVDREFFLEPVSEFMKITEIGEMNMVEVEGDTTIYSLQFKVLDSLYELEETERLKNKLEIYQSNFVDALKELEVEIECEINENRVKLSIECWMQISCMKDISKAIMEFHQGIEDLLQNELECRS